MPIWCSRREKSPVTKSGSIESARIAVRGQLVALKVEFHRYSQSSLTPSPNFWALGFAAAGAALDRDGVDGTAEPGARVGYFLAALPALRVTFDDDPPIM